MTTQQTYELRDLIRRLDAAALAQVPSAQQHRLSEVVGDLQSLACAILGHVVEGATCVECGRIVKAATPPVHALHRETKGEGMGECITPTCACGWRGRAESVANDWCFTNLYEQERMHKLANSTP